MKTYIKKPLENNIESFVVIITNLSKTKFNEFNYCIQLFKKRKNIFNILGFKTKLIEFDKFFVNRELPISDKINKKFYYENKNFDNIINFINPFKLSFLERSLNYLDLN